MKTEEILSLVDHTLLRPECTWAEIKQLCNEAVKYGAASVCIPPCFVQQAKKYLNCQMAVCTVIGFPNGYSTTKAKCFEAQDAIENGADEIDMVINIGWVKAGEYDRVSDEITAMRKTCGGKVLKVIIETCALTDEEKIALCHIVTKCGADFIKTSTGFSKAGATFKDVSLLRRNTGQNVGVKAAGGISGLDDAEKFISLGASRLGTSKVIKEVINNEI